VAEPTITAQEMSAMVGNLLRAEMRDAAQRLAVIDPPFAARLNEGADAIVEWITPVTVRTTEPLDGATNVPPKLEPRIVFDGPVDPASISGVTVYMDDVTSSERVPTTVIFSVDDNTAILTHETDMTHLDSFKVTVTTGVRNKGGQPLAQDYTFTFTS
jgi:Bacterial Ig-like domain